MKRARPPKNDSTTNQEEYARGEQYRQATEVQGSGGPGTILEEIARAGARRMLAVALEAEVDEFLARHADRRDSTATGWRSATAICRNARLVTGIGPIPIRQPRVDDRLLTKQGESRFSSAILPALCETGAECGPA